MIEIRNLKKSFGENVILKNVNLNIEKGDSIVIIGGSGCGKSTLLRCINLLNIPTEGEILFNGKNILEKGTDIDEYRRHVGMVYQHFNLFSHLNIMENMILAPMKVLKMSQDEAIAKAEVLLDKVGMINRKYRMPSDLSGGQKQRVAIARTLMMEPDVILFDEPTSALDPTMVDEVESVIKKLIDGGMTSVIVTHEMRFAEKISKRTVFLAEQGIYEEGPSKELFNSPKKELTRQFIYRARLLTREITTENIDYYSLISELRAFCVNYGLNPKQSAGIKSLMDEVLMPLLKELKSCNLNLACNENGIGHKIILAFPNAETDPLSMPQLDPIALKMLKMYVTDITSEKTGEGTWEVKAEL